jgi:hypothetical protein
MAAPVRPQAPQVPPQAPVQRVAPPAPGGVGAAPDTIQSAAKEEKGYIERFVIWVFSWITSLFFKIFPCLRPEEPVQQVPVAPPPDPEPPAPPQPVIPELVGPLNENLQLLNAFHRMSADEQNVVYAAIGQARHWVNRNRLGALDNLTYGEQQVLENPAILRNYIQLPNEEEN